MQFPIAPLAISIGVAAVDGVVSSNDVSSNTAAPGTAPPLSKQKALWVQGGSVALGLLGEFMGWHEDITEPFLFTGSALAARAFAFHMAQSGKATPVAAQGQVMRPTGRIAPNAQYMPADGTTARGYLQQVAPGLV